MTRPAVERSSRREDRAAAGAANDFRIEQRVAAGQSDPSVDDGGAHELEARSARFTDVLVLGIERDGIGRPEADQVIEMVCEVGHLDSGPITGKALFDADVESARSLRLESGIT